MLTEKTMEKLRVLAYTEGQDYCVITRSSDPLYSLDQYDFDMTVDRRVGSMCLFRLGAE